MEPATRGAAKRPGDPAALTAFAERLDQEDASLLSEGDEAGGSFAGEQLRALLLRVAAEGEIARLRALPWGIGTGFRQGAEVPSRGPAGIFFACRTPQGQRYWRYVRAAEVDTDELAMLRRIEPGSAPGVDVPAGLEDAWRAAADAIVAEHNARADPAQAEDRLPPSQRFALNLLRDPSVALPPGAEEADELLAVPRDAAVKSALSDVQRELAARTLSRDQAAERMVRIVREYGFTPVPPPPVLDPVTSDELGVVCWMQVLPELKGSSSR